MVWIWLAYLDRSRANVDELERLVRLIEQTNFEMLLDSWYRRWEGRVLETGRLSLGADCMFFNQHNEDEFPYYEACLGPCSP